MMKSCRYMSLTGRSLHKLRDYTYPARVHVEEMRRVILFLAPPIGFIMTLSWRIQRRKFFDNRIEIIETLRKAICS